MRLVFQMLPMLFFALAGFGSEIREFDLRTIERLGSELSRRDAMAALGVGTRDGTIWMVTNGRIQNTGSKADSAKPSQKRK